MEELRSILILFAIMIIFNCFTTFFLWRSMKDLFSKKAFLFWIFEFFNFMIVALSKNSATGSVFLFKIFINLISWYFLFSLAASLFRVNFSKKHYFTLFGLGYVSSLYFYFSGFSFTYYSAGPVFAIILYAQYVLYNAIKMSWKTEQVLGKSLLVVWVLLTIHNSSYPFLANKPEAVPMGFTIYASFIFAIAVYLPALLLNRYQTQYSRELESIVEKRTTQLFDQIKMASLGKLAGGVAHEINNPLSIIQGCSDAMIRMMKRENFHHLFIEDMLKKINLSILRIQKITMNLLHYSQGEKNAKNFKHNNLCDIVDNTLLLCHQKFLRANIQFEIIQSSDVIMVNADSRLISEVLLNLWDNSYNAVKDTLNPWIKVEIKIEENNAKIAITDSGKIIPEEIRGHIFDPFFSTRDVGEGAGLGLSVAAGIIKEHKGPIALDTHNKNTSFIIELPIVDASHPEVNG